MADLSVVESQFLIYNRKFIWFNKMSTEKDIPRVDIPRIDENTVKSFNRAMDEMRACFAKAAAACSQIQVPQMTPMSIPEVKHVYIVAANYEVAKQYALCLGIKDYKGWKFVSSPDNLVGKSGCTIYLCGEYTAHAQYTEILFELQKIRPDVMLYIERLSSPRTC